MINISKISYLIKRAIYRLITVKSLYKEERNINLEWINYSHASPEGSMPFKNHLEKNGLIIFDDSGKHHEDAIGGKNGVYRVVKECIQTKRYKVLHENPNFLVQKIN